MSALLIDFTAQPPRLTFDRKTGGFKGVAQRGMVNLATRKGDRLYTERGTNLASDALSGKLIDLNSAQHSANFAAGDTLFFQRQQQVTDDPDGLRSVTLTPAEFTGSAVNLNAQFVSVSGEVIGVTASV